jgi:hypothetical protein
MSRAPSTFRQLDVTRAVKAIRAAGYDVGRVLIDRAGRIEITTAEGQHAPSAPQAGGPNEWDEAVAKLEERPA